jgi:hypothetical protein
MPGTIDGRFHPAPQRLPLNASHCDFPKCHSTACRAHENIPPRGGVMGYPVNASSEQSIRDGSGHQRVRHPGSIQTSFQGCLHLKPIINTTNAPHYNAGSGYGKGALAHRSVGPSAHYAYYSGVTALPPLSTEGLGQACTASIQMPSVSEGAVDTQRQTRASPFKPQHHCWQQCRGLGRT